MREVDEEILVVPNDDLRDFLEGRTGFVIVEEERVKEFIRTCGFFKMRRDVEEDERYRQVIPYVVFMEGDAVLLLKRTERQAERRLRGKYSLGVGGHVRKEDGEDPWMAFLRGLEREFNEEVNASLESIEYLGIINDLSTPVSRVHVGLLYLAKGKFFGIHEEDMFLWKLLKKEDLKKYEGVMEGWSKLALKALRYYHLLS